MGQEAEGGVGRSRQRSDPLQEGAAPQPLCAILMGRLREAFLAPPGYGECLHCLPGRATTECPKVCMVEQQEWELWHSVRGRTKLRGGVGTPRRGIGTQRRCGSPQHGRELVQAQEAGGL